MDRDIKIFSEEVQKNTGVSLSVYQLNGKQVFGDQPIGINPDTKFDEVYLDEQGDATYFHLSRKDKKYIARIDGCSSARSAIAYLISQLAGKTEAKYSDATSFVKALVMGEVEGSRIGELCKHFGVVDRSLFVLAVMSKPEQQSEVIDFLANYNYGGRDFVFAVQEDVSILVKYADSMVREYCSSAEYAEMLSRSVYEETGMRIRIGVGGKVGSIAEADVSFSQALSAVKLMAKTKTQSNVHTYKEFALAKVLEEMPKNRQIDYIKILTEDGTKQFFADEEMLKTAQAFLDNNLNASETSRVLYIHRNTLNYRLDKIQNLTGFNLRKFSDAVTFKMITILYELLG